MCSRVSVIIVNHIHRLRMFMSDSLYVCRAVLQMQKHAVRT